MSIVSWPAGVPGCIMPLSPVGGLRDNRLSFDPDSPVAPIERPATSWSPEAYQIELAPMSLDQFARFQDWYRQSLTYGVRTFAMDHPVLRTPGAWRIVKADPPYQVRKALTMRNGRHRGIIVSMTVQSLPGGPTLTALFSASQPGFLAADFIPSSGRLFQDAGGVTPAVTHDQPIGLVRRTAGTVGASQPVALSRPTLARWPRGGRRNLLTWSEDVSQPVWSAVNVTKSSSKIIASNSSGQHRIDQTVGLASGRQVLTADLRAAGYGYAGMRLGGSGAGFDLINGLIGPENSGIDAGITPMGGGVWRCRIAMDGAAGNAIARINITDVPSISASFVGDGVSGIEILQVQVSNGQHPYQRVTTDHDVTEAGVPDIWHLYDDGGDSLPVTVPAGTYGLAYVDVIGGVTVTTATSDGSTPIDVLRVERMAGVVLRRGAFADEEEALIRGYWARFAA